MGDLLQEGGYRTALVGKAYLRFAGIQPPLAMTGVDQSQVWQNPELSARVSHG